MAFGTYSVFDVRRLVSTSTQPVAQRLPPQPLMNYIPAHLQSLGNFTAKVSSRLAPRHKARAWLCLKTAEDNLRLILLQACAQNLLRSGPASRRIETNEQVKQARNLSLGCGEF